METTSKKISKSKQKYIEKLQNQLNCLEGRRIIFGGKDITETTKADIKERIAELLK